MDRIQKNKKIATIGLCVVRIAQENKITKNRSKWVKKWILEKERYGHMPLIRELKENEQDDLKNYLRMSGPVYQELLRKKN